MFTALMDAPLIPVRGGSSHPAASGIYVLYEGGRAEHVGRTRNLLVRLRGHTSNNHYSASFAFKRTRRELNRTRASYRSTNSRAALAKNDIFGPAFRRQIDLVRAMEVRFLAVPDPVDQYLLELYAALELDLPLDEFDTH
jgi:hypothetical protein